MSYRASDRRADAGRALIAALALLLSPSVAMGQAITGSLAGTVTNLGGEPLPGVTVVARSSILPGVEQRVSDDRGRFAFLALPPGSYTLELRRIGFAPHRMTAIVVPLGATSTVPPIALADQATRLAEVVVSAAPAAIDVTTASTATILDSAQLRALPTGRDYHSALMIVPQGNPSPYGDGTGFGGATGFDNAYFIDGIHVTNPLSADGGVRLPFNFVREVQVVTGGYEAEYGRSQGAVVNVLTNSGGNQFSAEAFAFYSNEALRAAGKVGSFDRPSGGFLQYDVGAGFGGPIRKDKAWFYAAYNAFVEEREATFAGIGPRDDRLLRHLFAGKLTWRPDGASELTAVVLGDPVRRLAAESAESWGAPEPNVADPGAVAGDFRDGGVAAALRARRQFGNRVLLTAAASRLTNTHRHAGRGDRNDVTSIARIDDQFTRTTSGNFGRYIVGDTRRDGVEVSALAALGSHNLRAGASLERSILEGWIFESSFIQREIEATWIWGQGGFRTPNGSYTVPAVYLQDSWSITDRIRLNAGIRWEGQFLSSYGRKLLRVTDQYAPRIGIVYEPATGQKLSVSAGRYYEQMPLYAVAQMGGGFRGGLWAYPQNPLVSKEGEVQLVSWDGPQKSAERTVRGQHYDEATLGYEVRVGEGHVLSARAIVRALREALLTAWADTVTPSRMTLGNPGRGVLHHLPRPMRQHNALELVLVGTPMPRLGYRVSYIHSRTYGNLPGQFDSDLRVPASHATDLRAWPAEWRGATGLLPSDRTHLLKASGSYRPRADLSLGTAMVFATGVPLSAMRRNSTEKLFDTQRGSEGRTPTTWTVDLRAAWDVPRSFTHTNLKLLVDVHNLGNQLRAVDLEQVRWFDAGGANLNLNYGQVRRYQQPRSARLGFIANF